MCQVFNFAKDGKKPGSIKLNKVATVSIGEWFPVVHRFITAGKTDSKKIFYFLPFFIRQYHFSIIPVVP